MIEVYKKVNYKSFKLDKVKKKIITQTPYQMMNIGSVSTQSMLMRD